MEIKTARDIGGLIRQCRTQLRWSQRDLADRVGVSRLWIIQLEKGKRTAQIGLVLRALQKLRITLDASTASRSRERSGRR